jgi:cytochrome c-type biogenesis protein CcmH
MRILRAILLLLAVIAIAPAYAVQPDEMLGDPILEARARALSAELRCLVCQNQSIDDSDAPLARDIRLLLRERLLAGDTDQQVLDFLVARYGDFILLKPRFTATTALLWLAPPLLLLGGGLIAVRFVRRRGAGGGEDGGELTGEEEKRLRALMRDESSRARPTKA